MSTFKLIKLRGRELSPEKMGSKEPRLSDIAQWLNQGDIKVEMQDMVPVELYDGVSWLRKVTYEKASNVLGRSAYEAHEGVTFTSAKGAWFITGEPQQVEPPIGSPRDRGYVRVETELSKKLNLDPFVIEEEFVYRGFKGEDVSIGKVKNYRYFIAAYKRNGTPLSQNELEKTLLWRNYLSNSKVMNALSAVSKFMKKERWYLERMGEGAMHQYKVVWRDVAKEFIPAVETTGAIPDYTVNYVTFNNVEEAHYLLAILLSSQVNSVVRELAPWIGHVQPRFIKYFRIPGYNPQNETHRRLAEIGKKIHEEGEKAANSLRDEIEKLVEELGRKSSRAEH